MAPHPKRTSYDKGLVEVGDHCWAYLQPDGGWGWSNAGLISSGDNSLLVDTLFDLRLTAEMLETMRVVTGTAPIGTVVNTHANGDHCYGNQLVSGAEIISSAACAEEMPRTPPEMLAGLMAAAPEMGPLGEYLQRCFGAFHFEGIELTLPTRTFEGRLNVDIGDRTIELIEVGPAHTEGDVIAHVPDSRTVFTGDILFIEGTPLMWAGPLSNWIRACDLILGLDVDTIVPGHGPVTDKAGVRRVREYLEFIGREATARHQAGMSAEEAARDISLGEFGRWLDAERVAVNVDSIYRELDHPAQGTDVVTLFSMMASLAI